MSQVGLFSWSVLVWIQTVKDVLVILKAAKVSHYFDRYVQWLESASSMTNDKNMKEKLHKMIKKAKLDHDRESQTSLVLFWYESGVMQCK